MRVLIVEDDNLLLKSMQYQINAVGIQTDECVAGDEALFLAKQQIYDVIILDRMLPQMDGLSVLKELRRLEIATPIIMVTAMDGVEDRISGLEGGADDYLTKPFEVRELIARIKVLCRRPNVFRQQNTLSCGNLSLNIDCKTLSANDKSCELTVREAELLEFFFRNNNQIIPRETLLSRVWGSDTYVTESNLDNYIYFIRRRIQAVNGNVKVVTIRGIGYRLEEII